MKTKKDVENYLNEMGIPLHERWSHNGRVRDNAKYGTWLRKNDPIAFQCACNDYLR